MLFDPVDINAMLPPDINEDLYQKITLTLHCLSSCVLGLEGLR